MLYFLDLLHFVPPRYSCAGLAASMSRSSACVPAGTHSGVPAFEPSRTRGDDAMAAAGLLCRKIIQSMRMMLLHGAAHMLITTLRGSGECPRRGADNCGGVSVRFRDRP